MVRSTDLKSGRFVSYLQERRTLLLMLCLLAFSGAGLIMFGERIPIDGGYGYDGRQYGLLAKQFPTEVHTVNQYVVQRILPSLIVYCGLRATFRPLDRRHVIAGFGVYNLAMLMLVAWLWLQLCRDLGIRTQGQWLGFVGLFINYNNLTFNYWYPCLTDRTMLAQGMLLLIFYMRRQQVGLLATVIAAEFTAPSVAYSGMVLFLFPRQDAPSEPEKSLNGNISGAIFALSTLAAFALTLFPHYSFGEQMRDWPITMLFSTALAAAYIFVATRTISFPWPSIRLNSVEMAKRMSLALRIGVTAAIVGIVIILVNQITTLPSHVSTERFLLQVCASAVYRPLIFAVSHFVGFGPILFFTVFFWHRFSKEINRYGVGLQLFALGTIGLSLDSESRALVNLLPFVVLFTVVAVEKAGLKPALVWATGAIALVTSKVWMPINIDFPYRYFANFGPWMPYKWYILQCGAVLALGLLYYVMLRPILRSSASTRRP